MATTWRPMALVFAFSLALYAWDARNLRGAWILDDKGTLSMNPAVQGQLPWSEVWARDFWGHDRLDSPGSHKSWRPLCSASYRLNVALAGGTHEPFWFHVTDRVLHAAVSALAVPVAARCLLATGGVGRGGVGAPGGGVGGEVRAAAVREAALVVGLLFGAHPVHVEAVANTTGRAEVLCALFYFCGFIAFASAENTAGHYRRRGGGGGSACGSDGGKGSGSAGRSVAASAGMLGCAWCAVLCKEHGATLPAVCVAWDASGRYGIPFDDEAEQR